MQVSIKSFFDGLNVNSKYYIKQFQRIGVEGRFFLSDDDLMIIANHLPQNRYKASLIVKRAYDFLGASDE